MSGGKLNPNEGAAEHIRNARFLLASAVTAYRQGERRLGDQCLDGADRRLERALHQLVGVPVAVVVKAPWSGMSSELSMRFVPKLPAKRRRKRNA